MKKPLKPANEALRQQRLDALRVVGSAGGGTFDDIVRIAAELCGVPIAMVNFIDYERQWTKASTFELITECPRDISFCGHVVEQAKLLVVNDATADERFRDNPLVAGPPNVRSYVGVPLTLSTGEVMGSLCVFDFYPRALPPAQRDALCALARSIVTHLELRAIVLGTGDRERRAAAVVARDLGELRAPMDVIAAALHSIQDQAWAIADRTSLDVARRAFADLYTRVAGSPFEPLRQGAQAIVPDNLVGRALTGVDVLVVEDATIHQKVIRAMLEPHGARVHVATTGEEGLEMFRQRRFGLVLMDRHLPGIDGLQVIEEMRALEAAGDRRTPILGASATVDVIAREDFRRAGADDTLAKPIRLNEFWAKYHAVAGGRRPAA